MVRVLLSRIGVDMSDGGGYWNGPINPVTGHFVYVPVPETRRVVPELRRPYPALAPFLEPFGIELPNHLLRLDMHLDPDFEKLTFGVERPQAKQLTQELARGDLLIFYAGLRPVSGVPRLLYALVGQLQVDRFVRASELAERDRDAGALTRREAVPRADEVVAIGDPSGTGRFEKSIEVGEFRSRAYRVRREILDAWGGLSANDGYLQRSTRLPEALDANRLIAWVGARCGRLLQRNN